MTGTAFAFFAPNPRARGAHRHERRRSAAPPTNSSTRRRRLGGGWPPSPFLLRGIRFSDFRLRANAGARANAAADDVVVAAAAAGRAVQLRGARQSMALNDQAFRVVAGRGGLAAAREATRARSLNCRRSAFAATLAAMAEDDKLHPFLVDVTVNGTRVHDLPNKQSASSIKLFARASPGLWRSQSLSSSSVGR